MEKKKKNKGHHFEEDSSILLEKTRIKMMKEKKKKERKEGWWIKPYFIIFYLILLVMNIYGGIEIYNQETYDYWEVSECPKISERFKVVSPEIVCEEHFVFDTKDKMEGVFIFAFTSLILPFLVLFMWAIIVRGNRRCW